MGDTMSPILSATAVYKHFTAMREEILKHKWFESERAGKDVGFEYALVNWISRYRSDWRPNIKN
ncbi:DUF4032 domain-containing protein [bacterium]|nr:DUF4032 domain-containing protein [bacterium]